MRFESILERGGKLCFDVLGYFDGSSIENLVTIEIGFQTCRNVSYEELLYKINSCSQRKGWKSSSKT